VELRRQALIGPDELAEREDRCERIVQIVGDAVSEEFDRVHLLGLEQLPTEFLLPFGSRG
jgi:hypothetical protein